MRDMTGYQETKNTGKQDEEGKRLNGAEAVFLNPITLILVFVFKCFVKG